jgi:hypothetical protein
MSDDAAKSDSAAGGPTEAVPAEESDRGLIELIAAILLGLAGLLTGYAAYYGSLADGDSLEGYTSSQRTTADANALYGDYAQTYTGDQQLFLQYKIQLDQGNQDIADDIRLNLFSEPLEVATVAWETQADDENARATPLDRDEYVVQSYLDYVETSETAEQQFADAKGINEQGDNFGLASVFLAIALFAAGIAALFKSRKLSIALLAGSALLIIPGIWAIAKGKGWIS